jgi:hypothetical protein
VHSFSLLPDFKNQISFAIKKTEAFEVQDVVTKNLGTPYQTAIVHHVFFHLDFALLFRTIKITQNKVKETTFAIRIFEASQP